MFNYCVLIYFESDKMNNYKVNAYFIREILSFHQDYNFENYKIKIRRNVFLNLNENLLISSESYFHYVQYED